MKKTNISFKKSALKAAPVSKTITLDPSINTGHHVTIVDANSDDFAEALGINKDRATELEQDIVKACKAALGGSNDQLTLLQLIAIATTSAQNDNELVLATALISEAYVRNDFQGLEDETNEQLGVVNDATDENVEARDEKSTTGVPGSFEDFIRMMQANGAGFLAGAGEEISNDDDAAMND